MKNIFLLLFFIFFRQVDTLAQSYSKIDSLKNLLKSSKEDTSQVYLFDYIAGEYDGLMEYDSSYAYSEAGLNLSQELKFNKGIVIHLINCSGNLVRKHNQKKALELIFEAYKIAVEQNFELETLQALTRIAFIYSSFSNYQEAIKYKVLQWKKQEALLNNELYRKNNAKKLNGDSIKILEQISSLSFYYLKVNKTDSANFYAKKAIMYGNYIHKKDSRFMAYPLNCLGIAFRLSGNKDSALAYFRNSINQSLLSKSKKGVISNLFRSYWEIAILQNEGGERDSSIYNAELALHLVKKLKSDKDILDIEFFLAKLYSGFDNNKAVLYYQSSASLRDSLYNKEKTEQLQNITFNENERQKEIENQRKLAEEKRRKQINYAIIGLSIFLFLICFIALSRSIITSEKVNTLLAGLAVMMVFKFSNMLMDPYIEFKISDNPAILFFTAIVTASILSPIQKPIKKWLKVRMLAKAIAKAEPKIKKKRIPKKTEAVESDNSNASNV